MVITKWVLADHCETGGCKYEGEDEFKLRESRKGVGFYSFPGKIKRRFL